MLRLRAPAKINLVLRILGRRPDGFHDLETLFERLDLADELTVEPAGTLTLTCTDPGLSCGEDNLILRAARALQAAAGTRQGARLHLIKRIPIAAGLGGGSSDAAAALCALRRMWPVHLSDEDLAAVAASVGSDVPFFLQTEPFALGQGRGERCEPLAAGVRLAHVLVCPPERVATAEMYAAYDRRMARPEFSGTRLTPSARSITMMREALRNGSPRELASGLWNDLQPEATQRCPRISLIIKTLQDLGCLGTLVSGSGPAVFGLCQDSTQARAIAAEAARADAAWRIEVVHTDNPSFALTAASR